MFRWSCNEKLRAAEQTYYRWQDQFGGLEADEAKKLKELERENATLKRLLADAELEKAALEEIPQDRITTIASMSTTTKTPDAWVDRGH